MLFRSFSVGVLLGLRWRNLSSEDLLLLLSGSVRSSIPGAPYSKISASSFWGHIQAMNLHESASLWLWILKEDFFLPCEGWNKQIFFCRVFCFLSPHFLSLPFSAPFSQVYPYTEDTIAHGWARCFVKGRVVWIVDHTIFVIITLLCCLIWKQPWHCVNRWSWLFSYIHTLCMHTKIRISYNSNMSQNLILLTTFPPLKM